MADFDGIKFKQKSKSPFHGSAAVGKDDNDLDRAIELSLQEMPSGPTVMHHTIPIAITIIGLLIWFAVSTGIYGIKNHDINNLVYILSELLTNIFMLIFTIYIHIVYISIPLFKKQGVMDSDDLVNGCTSFDVYAVFSFLWFLMTALLAMTYGDIANGFFLLFRMLAILAPGYIHKTYIRLEIDREYAASNVIYLGDLNLYKICCILFLALQLLATVTLLPLNQSFFQDYITKIFQLDDTADAFHFSFIIAAVFGRPFVSILNFHLLMLYLTWSVNGDKPQTHHNLDLFTFSLTDSSLNALFSVAVMILAVVDIIFSEARWYRAFMLFSYVSFAFYHFYFLVHEGRKTHRRMTLMNRQGKKQFKGAEIDICTLFESSFVLIGGMLACVFYIMNINDYDYKFGEFAELLGWSVFMLSQYIFIIFIQLDYIFGRKLLKRPTTQKMLSWSQMVSAVSVVFLFAFEYLHFVHFLTHGDDSKTCSVCTVSYALFWCLLEYFIWSFVAINHMLHHVHEMHELEHEIQHFEESVKRKITQLFVDSKKDEKDSHLKAQMNAELHDKVRAFRQDYKYKSKTDHRRKSYLFVGN
eukprot:12448_1